MKFTTFIAENIRWTANKNPFGHLWAVTTTREALYQQLKDLGERYYHERKGVNVALTEFCLNYLALKNPTTFCQREVLRHFDRYWQRFLRLKSIFERGSAFPANGLTRMEQIASLLAKCTAFCLDGEQLKDILHDCRHLVDLTDREMEHLPLVVDLYKINYFCTLSYEVFNKNLLAEKCLATFLSDCEQTSLVTTEKYGQTYYQSDKLVGLCNSLGNSILSFEKNNVDVSHKMLVYKCGRNLFDTFCQHQFHQNCAYFCSDVANGKILQRYFLQDGCEIRKNVLLHKGKSKCKFVVDLLVDCLGESLAQMDGALCYATKNGYVAIAVVMQNDIAKCKIFEEKLTVEFTLLPNEDARFDVVTIVGKTYEEVAIKLSKLRNFGATRQRAFCGQAKKVDYTTPLCLTPSSNCFRVAEERKSKRLNFTYQMGSDDVATFVDNGGRATTLLKGFVFGTGGERVYAISNGRFSLLNCGQFTLDGKLTYQHTQSKCVISHGEGKSVSIRHFTPQKTVCYLPFERNSTVIFCQNQFDVKDGLRHYTVKCCGKVESFTTDGWEFSPTRLRHKLSGNLTAGDCLAICFAKDFQCGITITSKEVTPPIAPIVQESLVSTYLNYVNGKEVFCLNNFLKRSHPLALASIVYTNPQFVKNYLTNLWEKRHPQVYYDSAGKLQNCADDWLFDLGCIYYATLAKDENFPTVEMKERVENHLLSDKCQDQDLLFQALALKKASQIDGFDKVKCLVQFTSLLKQISAKERLNKMAQAMGILPLQSPTKEYLKQICNDCQLPKSWYYVSQLENLYGLRIVGASLRVCPTAFEDVLEQFALNFEGKRIYTTFTKGSVQCMTLNGTQCHQSFDPYSLQVDKNTLVVSY